MDGVIVDPFGPRQISAGAVPLRAKKGARQAARTSAFAEPNCAKIRPSATIGTATDSSANVSKLGHLVARCALRQVALNEVKSGLPGANPARNRGTVVLDDIQGTPCAETPR